MSFIFFFLMRSHKLDYYSKNVLLSNYVHIGYKKSLLNQSFRKAIYCFHNNIAIINLSYTISQLQKCAKFLLSLMIMNLKVCFAINDLPTYYKEYMEFRNQYFLINNWPSGILSNFETTRTSQKIIRKSNFIPTIPNAVLVFGFNPSKTLSISNEAKGLFIPCFCFIDTVFDPTLFPYWIAYNTKSAFSKLLLLNFINLIINRQFVLKRRSFLIRLKKTLSKRSSKITLKVKGRARFIKKLSRRIKYYLRRKANKKKARNQLLRGVKHFNIKGTKPYIKKRKLNKIKYLQLKNKKGKGKGKWKKF